LEPRIRVGAVGYLNTKPLLYGLQCLPIAQHITLSTGFPAQVGAQLMAGHIDVGLVPVAVLPKLPYYDIISDFCIGANGPVASVCIFSERPLHECTHLLLDYQSNTSVALARLLLQHHWHMPMQLVAAQPGFEQQIAGKVAAVVIGDRAFELRQQARYTYDLAEAWLIMTGLPFVFAAWVSRTPLPEDFMAAFNQANAYGLQHLSAVLEGHSHPFYDLRTYFTHNISYLLSEQKRAGLRLYLELVKTLPGLPVAPAGSGQAM
jgi:chorismate dehydratase